MTTPYLVDDISWDEAPNGQPVLKAYPDVLTHGPPWTIGFGSTGSDVVEGTVWTAEQCETRRDTVIVNTIKALSATQQWEHCNDARQDVLVNMAYQMGLKGLLGFTATMGALLREAWDTAAADMQASLWARQTPARAQRLIEQMRTGVRAAQPYDAALVVQPVQPKQESVMSVVSSLFHFVWDHTFAAAARSAATSNPDTAAAGISAVQAIPAPTSGSSNSPAGVASGPIAALENDLNDMVANFLKTTIDQIPVVGGVAEVTGLDTDAANAAKALLVLAEQHALTYLSALFSTAHVAVNTAVKGSNA